MGDNQPDSLEARVLTAQAGDVATRIARRPNSGGFRRDWSQRALIALHEASHAVVGAVCWRYPRWAAIHRTTTSKGEVLRGLVAYTGEDTPADALLRDDLGPPDSEEVELLCRVLAAPDGDWKPCAAELEKRTEGLVAENWEAILTVALELALRGEVYQDDISTIVHKFAPLPSLEAQKPRSGW